MHAYIFNIQRFSIHDGPGIRTTVFFQGCPLQCLWCHNAEGIPLYWEKSQGDKLPGDIQKYTEDELMKELLKDKVFFEESGGGVSFSGGEPLLQSGFLISILKRLREAGIHSVLDTSGYAPREVFNEITQLADLILFDLKIMDREKHKTYTDADNQLIHANLMQLISTNKDFRIRIPLVNNITADDDNLIGIAAMLHGKKNIIIDLLSYHDLGSNKQDRLGNRQTNTKLSAPDNKRLMEIRAMFESKGFKVNIGG